MVGVTSCYRFQIAKDHATHATSRSTHRSRYDTLSASPTPTPRSRALRMSFRSRRACFRRSRLVSGAVGAKPRLLAEFSKDSGFRAAAAPPFERFTEKSYPQIFKISAD
ncbi:MAG: hypothetical protein JSS02_08370 [Planctomycetes bacterium]|nr:hypothetical protein [Planctomycetota bacterium]